MIAVKIIAAVYLAILSVWDIRKKSVPRWALVPAMVLCIFGCIQQGRAGMTEHMLGGSMGVILYIVSRITKEAVGRADCFLVLCLGVFLGLFDCIRMLCISVGICCLFCMAGMGFRIMTKKYRVPFIPFLLTGFLCCF